MGFYFYWLKLPQKAMMQFQGHFVVSADGCLKNTIIEKYVLFYVSVWTHPAAFGK